MVTERTGEAALTKEAFKEILWNNVKDYCNKTSLHGFKYFTEPGRHWGERLIWTVVIIFGIWSASYIIVNVWDEYSDSPTITTVQTLDYPIWFVPFPAVAVCNINKISRKVAMSIAEELSVGENVTADELFQMFHYLGHLYDFDDNYKEEYMKLHDFLARKNRAYTKPLMKAMTPSCEEMLVRCKWLGRVRNCSELFEFRRTMDGFCCTFNYRRLSEDFGGPVFKEGMDKADPKLMKVSTPGFQMGLTVLVNPIIEDYYYPLPPAYGVKMLMYNPMDFPDVSSGGLIEKLVPLGNEVFFRLSATSVIASPEVHDFDIEQRHCLFQDELSEQFGGFYSFSDCLMSCRIKSITTLCGCLPFFYPSRGTWRVCSLKDVSCLNKYREKWLTLKPTEEMEGLEMEMEESLECQECLPACVDTSYDLQTNSARLTDVNYEISGFLNDIDDVHSHAVFHLFFGSMATMRLKQDILFTWFDLLSNFGGVCGLFVGFSLISVVELVYFFTLRLYFLVCDKTSARKVEKRKMEERKMNESTKRAQSMKEDLYWSEIRK